MSTKIYTGFKFIPATTRLASLALAKVAEDIEDMQRQRLHRIYASMLVSLMDRSRLASPRNKMLEPGTPAGVVMNQIYDRIRKVRVSRLRDPLVDWDIDFQCWESKAAGCVIGHVASELAGDVLELLVKKKIVVGYGYWNNVDPEEGVPAKEWRTRERVWRQALDGKSGLAYTFSFPGESIAFGRTPSWAEVEPFIPTLDERARRQAVDAVSRRYFKAIVKTEPDAKAHPYRVFTQFNKMAREDAKTKRAIATATRRYVKELLPTKALAEALRATQPLLIPKD